MKIRTELKFYPNKPAVMTARGGGKLIRINYDYLRSYKSNKRKVELELEKQINC